MKSISRAISRVVILGLLLSLAACSLPRGAATQYELTNPERAAEAQVSVYPVTRDLLPKVKKWSRGVGAEAGWPKGTSGRRTVIMANDTVDVVIWDNEVNSLLTSPEQKSTEMNQLHVSSNGEVFLPYVGKIGIAGMTPETARGKIQSAFEAIVPTAQVQLKLNSGNRNSIDLVAGMRAPGTYPMGLESLTVLDALSLGGGVATTLRNPRVRLQRSGKSYAISLRHLYEAPGHNIALRGNDKIIIEEDHRSFVGLGASGAEKLVYFEKDSITAIEAVSMIGGLQETRADAEGVLVLRTFPHFATKRSTYEPQYPRVVFVMNLTEAEGLFSASEFKILPGDVVLASESPFAKWTPAVVMLNKLLTISKATN
ncbi:polysaccharide biosynthesis/export family protein [Planktotalea sp.]|uniref:polysaccharide biosynthesis/export family protein n=1 Tax=Planktotalea sp. TaxID=2029877 RepID=UPI003D6C2A60